MLSGQSGQWILGRLSRGRCGLHPGGFATLLALLAWEAPMLAHIVPSQSLPSQSLPSQVLSESTSVSPLVEEGLVEEGLAEADLAGTDRSEADLVSNDAVGDTEVPEQDDLLVPEPLNFNSMTQVEAGEEEPEAPEQEPREQDRLDLGSTELDSAELDSAESDNAELGDVEPVSADDRPVVEAAETEELIEDVLGDGEDAATEIVVEPLADRCAALAADSSDAKVSDASETSASEAVTPETAEVSAAESSPPNQSEQKSSDATNPEAVISEDVAVEDVTSEEAASEAAVSEAAASEAIKIGDEVGEDEDKAGEALVSDEQTDEAIASEASNEGEDAAEEIDPEIAAKQAQEKRDICQLYRADQLYESGKIAEAQAIYQSVKPAFEESDTERIALVPVTDPEALSPGGQVYLREAQAGLEQNLETRTLVPLKLLTEAHPEYTPGHVKYADALVAAGQSDKGLEVLNHATALHPNDAEIVKANIALAADQGEWMEASMQARRFAQLNPDHPEAETFEALAQENLKLYQGDVRDRLTANTIANVLTGAVTYGVTGNIWNTLSTIQTTTLMLRGEEGVGNSISKSIQRQIPLVEDEEVVTYVNELGQKLAKVAGRDEFEYEFFVIMDENLNAFALPGGKIFVNAGAIAKTRSETELAGLLSHELAHAVLSHGFKLVSNGSLLSDISRFVPYAGYAANLVVLDYSRNMEREADELGTRILSAAGYPADGLHNLMQTLGEDNQARRPLFAWMSTHPETEERVSNIRTQIQIEGFDRYSLERVERHDRMRERVKVLIEIAKKEAEEERKNRPWWR